MRNLYRLRKAWPPRGSLRIVPASSMLGINFQGEPSEDNICNIYYRSKPILFWV